MRTANRLLILGAFFAISATSADETTKIYPAGGAEDLLNVTKTPDYIGGPATGSGSLLTNAVCTDTQGKVFKKEDPGYENCLKNRIDDQKKKGGKGASRGLSPGETTAIRTGLQFLPGGVQPTPMAPPAAHPPHVPVGL